MRKLPVYELKINIEEDAIVSAVSLVEEPAIESNFIAFNKDYTYEQFAVNDEKQELLGAAMIPDQLIYRKDKQTGDEFNVYFTADTIRQIAQQYAKLGYQNNMNLNHTSVPAKSYIFQSYIVDSSKGISAPKGLDVPDGSWIVGVKCEDSTVWNDIKTGKVKGFSIEGTFDFIEGKLSKETNDEDIKDILNQFNKIKITNMNMKNELVKVFKNLLGLQFGKVYTKDELKISEQAIGGKVEMIQPDGSLIPAEDGDYVMEDGFSFAVKDGMIVSIVGQDQPVEDVPAEDVKAEDVPTEDAPVEDQPVEDEKDKMIAEMQTKLEDLMARVEALEAGSVAMEQLKADNTKAVTAFTLQVKELNDNIQTLAKIPVQASKVNNTPAVEDKKMQQMSSLAKILGTINNKN